MLSMNFSQEALALNLLPRWHGRKHLFIAGRLCEGCRRRKKKLEGLYSIRTQFFYIELRRRPAESRLKRSVGRALARSAEVEKSAYSFVRLVVIPGEIMQRRKIGHSELQVAPLMFGGNVFGWTADEATSFSILDAFVDAGLNFIDTADVYSAWVPGNQGGESETILGKWFRQSGKREQIVLATKVSKHPQRKGLSAGEHSGGGRGLAAPPANRLHRRLFLPRR